MAIIFKIQLFAVSLIFFQQTVGAQTWQWAYNYENCSSCKTAGTSISQDANGYIYVSGERLTGISSTWGVGSCWLYKYDSTGVLTRKDSVEGNRSATDLNGTTFMINGNQILKYNSSFQKLWSKTLPNVKLRNLFIFPNGGFVTVGATMDTSQAQSVIYRFDDNGNEVWKRTGDIVDPTVFPSVCCDQYGNTYMSGGSMHNNYASGLLIKVDTAGHTIYSVAVPEEPFGVTVGSDQSPYLAGTYVNNTSGSTTLKKYIIRFNSLCQPTWTTNLSCNSQFHLYDLVTDKFNNLVGCGQFDQQLSLGSVTLTASNQELLLFSIGSTGSLLWTKITQGPIGTSVPVSIIADEANSILLTGCVIGAGNHQFDQVTMNVNSGYGDLLLGKLATPLTVAVPEIENNSGFKIFPVPASKTVHLDLAEYKFKGYYQIDLVNILGVIKYSGRFSPNSERPGEIDISHLSKGIYFIVLNAGDKREIKKIIIE
jgi:hypothetical protein